jgi:spermidine synthase
MDISDPIECGPGIELYFKGFYEMLARDKMSEGAVFVTQSGACGMLNYEEESRPPDTLSTLLGAERKDLKLLRESNNAGPMLMVVLRD